MVQKYKVVYKERCKLSHIGVVVSEEVMKKCFFEKLTLEEKAEWNKKTCHMMVEGRVLEDEESGAEEAWRWDRA